MSRSRSIPRRTFLKGAGAALALPWLEIMRPAALPAAEALAGKPPVRMAFIFVPNGVIQADWKPKTEGADYTLPWTLQPLASHKQDLLVLSELTQDNGRAKGDGAGDHARAASSFLTGAHPVKTAGADIRVGMSVDQLAASRLGDLTRLPSLELGIEAGRNAGNCDSGYSCAYSSNISWKTPTTPMAKEINPKLVFERLFGADEADPKERARRDAYRQSILDLVADDARRLQNRLGKTDRRKLDEYFTSVREVEQRIARSAQAIADRPEDFTLPDGVPREFQEHVRLMYDLLVLAFQTDTTRIATFMVGNAGSNRAYTMIDVKEGWHSLSHHGNDKAKTDQLKKIDRYNIEQFAYFLQRLKSVKEGDGTLLDNSMIVYGSGLGDGNRHSHHDLPILLAGRGGGRIQSGRHIRYAPETPMNNLFLTMLDILGADVEKFGDSSGRLPRLDG